MSLAYRCFLPDLTGFSKVHLAQDPTFITACEVRRHATRPRVGIQSHYGGLWVQGTASPPPSTTGKGSDESDNSYESYDSNGHDNG